MIPKPAECFSLMDQYEMLDNIRAHSIMVGRIAEHIAAGLHRNGYPISVNLALSAALLHDIGKTSCLYNGEDHSLVGHDICNKHGYAELAPLVRQHVILVDGYPHNPISEKEIVYYADKRVKHDKIVSLDSRQEYIIRRYGLDDPKRHNAIKKNFQQSMKIEQALFELIGDEPEKLAVSLPRCPQWLVEMETIECENCA